MEWNIFDGMKTLSFTLRGFKRAGEMLQSSLGELEREIMETIWQRGETSVREIHGIFGEKRAAYTTLMTTLDRLYKKGLLERRKDGRAFLYSPRISREEFRHSIAKDIINGLLGKTEGETKPVLACIVEAVGERDSELLDELEIVVRQSSRFNQHTSPASKTTLAPASGRPVAAS